MSVPRRSKNAGELAPQLGIEQSKLSTEANAAADRARVLLVEDECLVAKLLKQALESSGFQVQLAYDGESALDLVAEEVDRPDLLVTDFALPGISGVEVARRLSIRWPGLRVLLTSGYAYDALAGASKLSPDIEFLAKPFTPRAFIRRVTSLLAG